MSESFSKISRTQALDSFKFSKKDCCNISFLAGYFISHTPLKGDGFIHKTDIEKSAKSVKKLLSRYDIDSSAESAGEGKNISLVIDNPHSLHTLREMFKTLTPCEECTRHFLTGVFVSEGILVDPQKEYHLEFSLKTKEKAQMILNACARLGFDFKIYERKSGWAVYTKNSEEIEEFLINVGAQNACLEIMGGKVVKDVRNRLNRITNCETANIAKTAQASRKYIDAINKLINSEVLYAMGDDIQQLAQLKLENPDLSLPQLGRLCQPPLSKSAVNRRLQKICAAARSLEE